MYLGDDNVLVKYLNPHSMVVCTQRDILDTDNTIVDSTLYIHVIDSVSGKILVRSQYEHATGPFHGTLLENFILITYWNLKVRSCYAFFL